MSDLIDEDVVKRIQNIYETSTDSEKRILRQILEEISLNGYSQTYEDIWLADFKEVPVTIDQFITDPLYLGEVTNGGKQVYPFWRETLHDVFLHGNLYNEIILSGATRIGKTSTSITILAYMLYKLMLYRNPHEYFQKKAVSRFTIAFANLTKDLAAGVGYHEFHTTLQASKWFMDHGERNKSSMNPLYIPEGGVIDIVPGSSASNFLGMQIWCLVGDTVIATDSGFRKISDCVNRNVSIYQFDGSNFECSPANIEITRYVSETIQVTFTDGSTLEGTPDHLMMMYDGTYKSLGYLSQNDFIYSANSNVHKVKISYTRLKIHRHPIPVYDVINVEPYHNFSIIVGNSVMISHNCALMDETNFAKAGIKDINLAKEHMKKLYDTINARISGTFRIRGEVYGKLVASSSKNTDSDFLSDHIQTQQNAGNSHLYLVDKPQWEVLPASMFSDKKFHFTVGDRYKRGFVISPDNDDEDHHREYINQGYTIMEAPEEFRGNFLADYDISLRDIAGISVVGAMGFITQDAITPNISETRKNPFYTDVIQVGTQDPYTIEEFFHIDAVPTNLKSCLMNIHLDLSETGDRTGIAGVCIDGSKIVTDYEGRKTNMPYFKEVFSVGIERPTGDRLSFQKVVNFLLWLRRNGFSIGTISTDQYQSSYMREVLNGQGFHTDKISVDRSEDPYIGLKNILYDQRIELIRNDLRDTELVNLQRINNKIDHPMTMASGGKGSKDVSDALCGACYTLTLEHSVPIPRSSSIASAIASVNGKNSVHANMNGLFASMNKYTKRK